MRETPQEKPEPKKLEDYTAEDMVNGDPEAIAEAIKNSGEIEGFVQRRAAEEVQKIAGFAMKAFQGIEKMRPEIRLGFRRRLLDLGEDLELLLDLGQLDDDARGKLLLVFLQFTDDDDGDDEPVAPEPVPRGDGMVPA